MRSGTILIVEDEAVAAFAVRMMVQDLGFDVCGVVDSGEQAIERALADKPDVILMDIRLKGGMTGVEAAKAITAQRTIPIVFVTAYTASEIKHQIQRLDLQPDRFRYLSKPISESAMGEILFDLASAAPSDDQTDAPESD